jgi:formiminotetrahydrofolate cyclodeaminase
VTAQIDTRSINLVSGVRSNLVSDVQSGALLVRASASAYALNLP